MIYFTSDTHFGDKRLNLYGRDIAAESSEEIDELIVKNWNKIVKPDDTVYHIGDVAHDKKDIDIVRRLNGRKILIKGNYDRCIEMSKLFELFNEVHESMYLYYNNEEFYLVHEPENGVSDMFNIVGHIHALWRVQRNMINVGSDAWFFTPISMDQILFYKNAVNKFYDKNVFAGELPQNKIEDENNI